ncbi:hypothetical protein MTP04_22540 [Lysinibacillus sp. PLM2]|nr:hypothetical protein MTP04_22540 [Lysinibacillus sp. PLM2]
MRIEHIITDEVKRQLNYQSKHEEPKRQQEKLSEYELKELMGQYQPTYKRKNGAYRQR